MKKINSLLKVATSMKTNVLAGGLAGLAGANIGSLISHLKNRKKLDSGELSEKDYRKKQLKSILIGSGLGLGSFLLAKPSLNKLYDTHLDKIKTLRRTLMKSRAPKINKLRKRLSDKELSQAVKNLGGKIYTTDIHRMIKNVK